MKDFLKFEKECLRLQEIWGLKNWELTFETGNDKDTFAKIRSDNYSHKATITFFGMHNTGHDYKKTARHEMIHLLLGRLTELGEKRFIRQGELIEAEEEVVQLLLRIIK